MNLAGGLSYHLTAVGARRRWEPFRKALATWLEKWNTGSASNLVLIGPSAGYNLPEEFLYRFKTIEAFDPDPIARVGLKLRLGVRASGLDIFRMSDEEWMRFLDSRRGSVFLFCNLLGQLLFLFEGEKLEAVNARLKKFFEAADVHQIRWASFHDRWSGKFLCLKDEATFQEEPTDQELARAFLGEHARQVEIVEHKTSQLFPPHIPRFYLRWQFKKNYVHVIESVIGRSPV